MLASNPILRESLLLDLGGRRKVSKIVPSVVYNTVDHPIFPSAGARYTASVDLAGLGGNTQYVQVRGEGIKYIPLNRKFAFGFRGEAQWIKPYGATTTLPIFEKFFLGGEYSVRGFDIRSIGPRDPFSGIVTGGNKSLLVQRRVLLEHRRARSRAGLLRCGPGQGRGSDPCAGTIPSSSP